MKQLVLVTFVAIMSVVTTCPVFAGEWVPCARENQNCTVPGTKLVRYGAGNRWTTKLVTHRVYCANEEFGDPAPGRLKTCYYQENSSSGPSGYDHGNQPHWMKCATEGRFCSFNGRTTVRYGAGNRWTTQTAVNGVLCGNDVFGDPAPGAVKACYIKAY